jgi:glycosyltransferase involved in cell wall biosynthesis
MSHVKNTKINALQVLPTMDLQAGGLPRSVLSLSHYLAENSNVEIVLMSQTQAIAPHISTAELNFSTVIKYVGKLEAVTGLSAMFALAKIVKLRAPSVIHNHGIWTAINHWASVRGRKSNLPTVVQPHGMLEEWSLEQKKIKKKSAMWFYQRKDLEGAAIFIATSEQEYASIRRLGLDQPIAIIPHGVNMPSPERNLIQRSGQKNTKTALFFSRIHPKKGLKDLLTAWARIKPLNWSLMIVGSTTDLAYAAEIKTVIKDLNLTSSIHFVGPKEGDEKDIMFRSADLFILPSYSENFGLVVLEALSYGLPVITTTETPWVDLGQKGCGWVVEPGPEPLTDLLEKVVNLTDPLLASMGDKAKLYASRYRWDLSADSMRSVYAWIAGRGSRPENVFLG